MRINRMVRIECTPNGFVIRVVIAGRDGKYSVYSEGFVTDDPNKATHYQSEEEAKGAIRARGDWDLIEDEKVTCV